MEILYFIIVVNSLLIFKLWWDYRAKNIKKRIINHTLSAAIDGLFYIVAAWLLTGWDAGGYIILAAGYRWIMFDAIFGLINGNGIDWHGTSSKLDIFLTKVGKYHFLIKLIPIIIGLMLILL